MLSVYYTIQKNTQLPLSQAAKYTSKDELDSDPQDVRKCQTGKQPNDKLVDPGRPASRESVDLVATSREAFLEVLTCTMKAGVWQPNVLLTPFPGVPLLPPKYRNIGSRNVLPSALTFVPYSYKPSFSRRMLCSTIQATPGF